MRVILIDDHAIFSELLEIAILRMPGITSVTKFNSGDDFVYTNPALPDLIILDIRMPGMDGIKVIEHCRKTYSKSLRILVLSFITNIQVVKQAIHLGANGYISKSASVVELTTGINDVMEGKEYFSSVIRNDILKTFLVTEEINFHLTGREQEVLKMTCKGFTMKEIAYELDISYHTAHYYYKNILRKLKISKSKDLIVFAMMNGLYIPDING